MPIFDKKNRWAIIIFDRYISVQSSESWNQRADTARAPRPAAVDATDIGAKITLPWCNNQIYRYKLT